MQILRLGSWTDILAAMSSGENDKQDLCLSELRKKCPVLRQVFHKVRFAKVVASLNRLNQFSKMQQKTSDHEQLDEHVLDGTVKILKQDLSIEFASTPPPLFGVARKRDGGHWESLHARLMSTMHTAVAAKSTLICPCIRRRWESKFADPECERFRVYVF